MVTVTEGMRQAVRREVAHYLCHSREMKRFMDGYLAMGHMEYYAQQFYDAHKAALTIARELKQTGDLTALLAEYQNRANSPYQSSIRRAWYLAACESVNKLIELRRELQGREG